MLWVLLDVVMGVLAVLLLAGTAFLLYKRLRVLTSTVGSASTRVGELTPGLAVQRAPGDVG